MNWLKKPIYRVRGAWILLWVSVVTWPITSFTVFKNEPQGILALSWLAIILTCLDIIATTDIRDNQ